MSDEQKGFTLVETIVTIVVASIFIASIVTLYGSIDQAYSQSHYRAVASDVAYSYLRKYTASGSLSSFTCSTATGSSNTNDLTINQNAVGQTLESGTVSSLPKPTTYSVIALAPYGCSGTNAGKPLIIRSTVTYGANNASIQHAQIVGQ